MRLSLCEHTAFLHGPWRKFYEYRCVFAFLGEGSMRDRREGGRMRKYRWRRDVPLLVGGERGGRSGLES
jgi:hypothetical protein